MNKNDAINLIKDTFETSFSKDRFVLFAKNLLNTFDESKAFHAHGYVLEVYKSHVKTYERLGTYIDPNGKKIDILIVYLQKESSIERARTAQRNFIAQYLKDRGEKDAGLIAFVSPNLNDWRFSFVKMEYKFEKTDKGYIKAKEKFTPSKRYSYLVGPHEASHTAQSRMYPVILNDEINPTLEEIEAIFSVEKVTKEFFEEYKRLFLNLADEFTKNKEFKSQVVEANKVQVADFVKKLMGQIVFLYFLQKKGWLGVKPGEKWGAGDKRFMHNLFDKQYCDYQNFYNDVLEPLFYDTLNRRDRGNNEVINDQSSSPYFKCRIPYLNGGLFTPVYDWSRTKIFIENKYFKDIFDVFDTFNFTVYESDPIEKEVAVDPEMLGKVFENLLEIRDRKSKGAFYTPREIVHYMCQESLINYLISQSGFPEERIRNLMKAKNQEIARTVKDKEKIENMPELKEIAIKVNDLLKKVKICDPAVGSGAFPMGLLKEISTTRYFLNKHFIKETNKNGNLLTEYDIKKATLENCIYGVDIDPGAVEIARLRFWLSLVVEHEIEEIEPLPNLDYKIMQGNSLIELLSPNLLFKTTDDNRNKLIDHLTQAKTEYFNLSDSLEKAKKREEINLLIRSIINYDKDKQRETIWQRIHDMRSQMGLFGNQKQQEQLNIGDVTSKEISKELKQLQDIENVSKTEHFEWHLNFNEVFEKGGFDIVIANPPYVRVQNMSYKEIDTYKKTYHTAYKRLDISILFLELSSQILNSNGSAVYITSSQFTKTEYGREVRKFLKPLIDEIVYFGDSQVFESATNYTSLFFLKNKADMSSFHYVNAEEYSGSTNLDTYISNYRETLDRNILVENSWELEKQEQIEVLSKIKKVSNISLTEIAEIEYGLVTGADSVFVININNKELLGNKFVYPLIKPSNTDRYFISEPKQFVIYPYIEKNDQTMLVSEEEIKSESPKIYQYLLNNKKKLMSRKDSRTSVNENNLNWYSLMRHSSFTKVKKIKILTQALCTHNEFCLDVNSRFFTGGSVYSINSKRNSLSNKSILGLLNSKLCEFYYQIVCPIRQHGYRFYAGTFLKTFPIAPAFMDQSKIFDEIVGQILTLKNDKDYPQNPEKQRNVSEYEKQIDQIVYKLYDLTPEEIEIVEKQNK